ncbi:unnamed protein product [Ophioblennius macclurei]
MSQTLENMDDTVESFSVNSGSDDEEDNDMCRRPPSSYGSMKSDCEELDIPDEEMEEHEEVKVVLPDSSANENTGLQLIRSDSPETHYTMTTMQTKPPGALVLETGSEELLNFPEEDDEDYEDDDDILIVNSPEPPEFIEPDLSTQADENGQSGRIHPENDLPHVFKSIQSVLSSLDPQDFYNFKLSFHHLEPKITMKDVVDEDVLNFVDKTIEVLGRDQSLLLTLRCLESKKDNEKENELRTLCKRVLTRYALRSYLIRKHEVIHEGVVKAGCQCYLTNIYVEPEISTNGCGGVNPFHELREPPPPSLQLPGADTFVGVNDLFRLQKDDGTAVRTVVTTGLPGSGMSVSVAKFSLDWGKEEANRDVQFVIKLSFRKWWNIRTRRLFDSDKVSIMEVIEYFYPDCKNMTYLEEEGCKFLVIMDSFDCYRAPLDWENAPVINGNHVKALPDDLIVNIIRGNVLSGAHIWILGRRAAVSQIPSQFIDAFTEIQGFSDEMKDEFLSKRATPPEVTQKIVEYFKRLPSLVKLARHPFVSWMVFSVFKQSFRYRDFGQHRPRITPFYINLMMVQMNRRLQFYYGQYQGIQTWSAKDKTQLVSMAEMAFKMLKSDTAVFFEDDVKRYGLDLTEVTVLSGMCTELAATAGSDGRRQFCFLNFAFQEFLAALYVFIIFRAQSKNALDSAFRLGSKTLTFTTQPKSAADLLQAAVTRTQNSKLGHLDMFLRFLCGLLNPDCHNNHLCGFLYPHNIPKMVGLDKAEKLLRETIDAASPGERLDNLKECLREMTQQDL